MRKIDTPNGEHSASLEVIYSTTTDDELGPRPPVGDGWHLVHSANGRTLWRLIHLTKMSSDAGD